MGQTELLQNSLHYPHHHLYGANLKMLFEHQSNHENVWIGGFRTGKLNIEKDCVRSNASFPEKRFWHSPNERCLTKLGVAITLMNQSLLLVAPFFCFLAHLC